MKKILFMMLICIVAAASYAADGGARAPQGGAATGSLAAQGAAATPKIKIVTADIDLGEVEKNKIFDFKIEVKNVGKEDLVITNVSSSCGCLEVTDKRWGNVSAPQGGAATDNVAAASYAANGSLTAQGAAATPVIVKPNHSIYITARVDTNKVGGEFEKMIHVFSNDPENKDVVWKVRGKVLAAQGAAATSDNVAAPSYGANSAHAAPQGGATTTEGKVNFAATDRDAKIIMVFYSPGCKDCREIMEKFLPEIKQKYNDKILIVDYNIDNMESYGFFLELQNRFDERAKTGFFNPKPPVVFVNNKLLYGVREIRERLEELIR